MIFGAIRHVALATLALMPFAAPALAQPAMAPTHPVGSPTLPPVEHWTWGAIPEIDTRIALWEDARAALEREDFAALDKQGARYRGADSRTAAGDSPLYLYYAAVVGKVAELGDAGSCDTAQAGVLDRWQAASPATPGPWIVRAELMERDAWCLRGGDTADSVASEAWAPFNERISAGIKLLQDHRAIASVDPEYYAALLALAIPGDQRGVAFRQVLDEATTRFPYYYGIYFAAYRYFQPQWDGAPGDIDRFAEYAVAKTRARDGTSAYFRIYQHVVHCKCYNDLVGMRWSAMQAAMVDMAHHFPTDWAYVQMASFACATGSTDNARIYLAKLTVNDARTWSAAEWNKCRRWVGASPHPFPADAR